MHKPGLYSEEVSDNNPVFKYINIYSLREGKWTLHLCELIAQHQCHLFLVQRKLKMR